MARPHRFKFERECLARGLRRIGGLDEAGRGPLAGPVVAAVVVFPCDWIENDLPRKLRGLNDSKQLAEEEREKFYALLTANPEIRYGVAVVDVDVIDRINILQASLHAMNLAMASLEAEPEHSLVDGPHISTVKHPQTPLIDGDARSYSIAAASIIAKVTRDRIMVAHDKEYPGYGFAEHKGYSTPKHLEALRELGPCAIHRRSFAPIRQDPPAHPEFFS
ncbi:MAG TPA: ribonuclease HII [Methylomirabilota bacterium]|nr:ribonuclease HII [Methylomirabilota bacterium]